MTSRTPRRMLASLLALALAFVGLAGNPAPVAAAWGGSISVYVNDGDGAGRVTTDDGGIDCVFGDGRATGDCLESYTYADFLASATVVVHLTPATGSYVCQTQLGCQLNGAALSYNLSFNRGTTNDFVVAPEFWLRKYEVQVDILGPGSLSYAGTSFFCTPTGDSDYCHAWKYGQTATLIATPDTGYPFTGWSGGPCEGVRELTCEFTVTGPEQLTAQFGLVSLTIHRSTGGFLCELGSDICLQPGQTSLRFWKMVGSIHDIDAIPDAGFAFDHWNAGPCTGKPSHCSFTLTTATDLTATFRKLATPAPSPGATQPPRPTATPRPTPTLRPETTAMPSAAATGAGQPPASDGGASSAPASPSASTAAGPLGTPVATLTAIAATPGQNDGTGHPSAVTPAPQVVDAPAGGAGGESNMALLLIGLAVLVLLMVVSFLLGRRGSGTTRPRA